MHMFTQIVSSCAYSFVYFRGYKKDDFEIKETNRGINLTDETVLKKEIKQGGSVMCNGT